MRAVYIVGEPGVGKSTLMEHLTDGLDRRTILPPGITEYGTSGRTLAVELGHRRHAFSGTDALPMNVQPTMVRWLEQHRPPLVLGEGDRLANGKFFDALLGLGYELTLVHLAVDAEELEQRRLHRARQLGRLAQDPKWLKGRATKVRGLVARYPDRVLTLDAAMPPESLARRLAAVVPLR